MTKNNREAASRQKVWGSGVRGPQPFAPPVFWPPCPTLGPRRSQKLQARSESANKASTFIAPKDICLPAIGEPKTQTTLSVILQSIRIVIGLGNICPFEESRRDPRTTVAKRKQIDNE